MFSLKYFNQDKDNLISTVFSELKILGVKVPKLKKFKLNVVKVEKAVSETGCKIFGVSLNDQEWVSDGEFLLPKFVAMSTAYLERFSDKEEGLFRKAGNVARQKKLRVKLELGESLENSEPNDVASLLKQWLRELPEPLIPLYLQDVFVRCLNVEMEENRVTACLLTCLLLLPDRLHTLKHLLSFMANIASDSDRNKMSAYNLALIMAPNIFSLSESSDKSSVNFSHLCGLLLSFYFTKNIKTLRSTGESETKTTLFHRYLQTIRHIQKWYEGNVFDIDDPAHRSLSIVRGMHARVGKKMSLLNDGIVYVSQWDMAVTQWAFIGPMVLFRSRVGLHGCSDEDYDALIHFWRSIGFLLGIEDRYNLCDGDYSQVVSACKALLHKEYKVKVAAADPVSVSMGKNVVAAMSMIDHLLTWNSISTYIHELVSIPCPETMGFVDFICHYLMRFVMLFVIQNSTLRQMFNDLTRWKLDLADKKDLKLMTLQPPSRSVG